MMTRWSALLGAAALALAGCSSDSGGGAESLPRVFVDSLTAAVAARRGGRPERVTVTPRMLAETKVAALQVNPEQAGGSDFLRRIAQRRDSDAVVNEVWQSSDNAQIFLRNGVLVGTRGVGTDIISSDARATVGAVSAARAGGGIRRYVVSNGDLTYRGVVFRCDVRNLGVDPVTIVNQSFTTVHLRESCVGGPSGDTVIANDYWVLPQSGLVKKSRQWAGPASGYFEIILLKN